MPQKNFYYREEEADLFTKAVEVSEHDSLSPIVIEALKMYIASKTGDGDTIIEIKVGNEVQRFLGTPIKD